MSQTDETRAQLEQAVVASRNELLGFVRKHAGAVVLRFESPDDLVQSVVCAALAATGLFTYRSDDELRAWLFRIARNHLANRRRHWTTLKRGSRRVLRLHMSQSGSTQGPAASQTSPSLFALRREQLSIATRALALLSDRDRQLVTGSADGATLTELAEQLGISYDGANKARARALDRFRKCFEVLSRARGGGGSEA